MTEINDSSQQLKFARDDLKAIQSVILTVGDHPEYANADEALKVIGRALDSITNDIQESIDSIGQQQGKAEYVQQV